MSTSTFSRPMMTRAELAQHETCSYGRDYRYSDDGYSDMEYESKAHGWHPLAGWGRDGWDLGEWPYVAFYVRRDDATFRLLQIVEGDRTEWSFATQADLYAAIDYLFLWYAAEEDWSPLTYEQREDLDAGTLAVDEKFRGPYREREGDDGD